MTVPLHRADRALSLVLRLALAGALCCPLVVGLCGLKVARDLDAVGFSSACLGDTCVWLSDGAVSLTYPPVQPCWRVSWRPC